MPSNTVRRRSLLATLGAIAVGGCVGRADRSTNLFGEEQDSAAPGGNEFPLVESDVPLPYDFDDVVDNVVSGGVSQDGIPSIDDPVFVGPDVGDEMMDPDDIVFGVEHNGVVRAYPQYILVWHEIVNDRYGDQGVAITYCPLTGTAIGYERGGVEFGVSGRLVNSNLIMYDREYDSWWSQILGTAFRNEKRGYSLREIPVVWTTWGRWKDAHPQTEVLSEDTGFIRNYESDPYGSYTPPSGYYTQDWTIFASMHPTDDFHKKTVFIGFRSRNGAMAVAKDRLREDEFLTGSLNGTSYSFAYDSGLDTGYAYRNPEEREFDVYDGRFSAGREGTFDPDELPLERVNAFDAMWFAWYAFYPHTEVLA